jgi:hypothetical protein
MDGIGNTNDITQALPIFASRRLGVFALWRFGVLA